MFLLYNKVSDMIQLKVEGLKACRVNDVTPTPRLENEVCECWHKSRCSEPALVSDRLKDADSVTPKETVSRIPVWACHDQLDEACWH